jgi:hypothetical protein
MGITSPVVNLYPPPTPTLVQHLVSTSNPPGIGETGNNFKFTLPNPVLAGNVLILGIASPSSGTFAATPVSDTNGTWPTTPTASVNDTNANVDLDIFVLPNAASGIHTITVNFSAAVIPFQYTISEFNNIATTSPANGSAGASVDAAPTVNSGSFTPGNNDANGGNLIWSLFWSDANASSGNQATTIAAGSGFTLLDADGTSYGTQASTWHASQYTVQTTAASINPSMTFTMSPANDEFIGLSLALKVASAGTAPSGMRIAKVIHSTTELPPASLVLQTPSVGNLLVVSTHGTDIWNVTAVTSSASGSLTKYQGAADTSMFWVVANRTPSLSEKLTFSVSGTPQAESLTVYDIVGANTAPVGNTAFQVSVDLSNLSSKANFPDITPSVTGGILIASCTVGQGPVLNVTAPSGAIFDFVNYTGQTDNSSMDNSDCRAHQFVTSTAAQSWTWSLTSVPGNSGYAGAIHLKAP